MLVSIVAAFESRFNSLCTFSWIFYWKKIRNFFKVVYSSLFMLSCAPYIFFVPDQKYALQLVFENLPCLPSYIHTADNFVLALDASYHVIVGTTIVVTASGLCVFFVFTLIANGVQQSKENSISASTYQMQKRFFKALIIQIIIPLIWFIIPLLYILYSIVLRYYNQGFTNISILIMNMHGFVSTVVMIYVHGPYREAISALLKTRCTKPMAIKNISVKRCFMAHVAK
uniref:Serpentine Receptor, class H n=1 Tax=Caenorhabditis tropicalis TaxID=1561998 RepID=A0A1I7TXZ5_9PELO